MDLKEICAREPRFQILLEEARLCEPKPEDREYWRQYEYFKARLSKLVGWGASDLELRTPAAYSTCINGLLEAMPISEEAHMPSGRG